MFTHKELDAVAHALGNVLCQKDHPDRELLTSVREKIRLHKVTGPELFMAAKDALDVMPTGSHKDRLIEALLPPPGQLKQEWKP